MSSAAVHSTSGFHSTTFEPINQTITSNKSNIEKHHVQTQLNYFKPNDDGTPPAPAYVGKPETYERPVQAVDVTVHDISGEVDKYSLDGNGFQIYTFPSTEKDFLDNEKIKAEYYPETERLLKEATGASRIFIFDHTIRRAATDTRTGVTTAAPLRGPVNRVHIDQSYAASRSRIPHHLPDLAEKLLSTRHQIINVWRPIKPIYRSPLAVADAHSVPDEDLVPVGLIYPDRNGETLSVKSGNGHKWFFKYGQKPEEVTLIKCYDSKLDGRARRVPHTAFVDPGEEHREGRESIEVRALVFHENESAE